MKIIYYPIEYENEKIDAFLYQHQYDALPEENGLYYIEIESGTGDQPISFSRVEVLYDAMLIDGRIIASTGTTPRTFRLNSEFRLCFERRYHEDEKRRQSNDYRSVYLGSEKYHK